MTSLQKTKKKAPIYIVHMVPWQKPPDKEVYWASDLSCFCLSLNLKHRVCAKTRQVSFNNVAPTIAMLWVPHSSNHMQFMRPEMHQKPKILWFFFVQRHQITFWTKFHPFHSSHPPTQLFFAYELWRGQDPSWIHWWNKSTSLLIWILELGW